MKSSRIKRKPARFGNWEEGDIKVKRERNIQKLWEIEDVYERRGTGDDEEVLVKWSNWDGPNSWVKLRYNPELKDFLSRNRANPECTSLTKSEARNQDFSDTAALKQAIFDSLGDIRYTSDGSRGLQKRISLKVPFRAKEFQPFRILLNTTTSTGNVEGYVRGEQLNTVLGNDWSTRMYKTSTETYVDFRYYIHLSWGYKERVNYDHAPCLRCTWKGEENNRPELCNPVIVAVPGPPWLCISFTRSRRNMVTGDICKRKNIEKV